MKLKALETVVLNRDLPEQLLRVGDLGAVVEVYGEGCADIEFVTASGRTAAIVTLCGDDLRPVLDNDLMSVRSLGRSA